MHQKETAIVDAAFPTRRPWRRWLERVFELEARHTSVFREFLAALTTFATMSYVLAVHPQVLSVTGMNQAELITVTALAAGLFSILMGLVANVPIALAPGMGVNAFFAYSVVLTMGVPWQAALGLTFYSAVLFLILSVTGVRHLLLKAFPDAIKTALTVGIGVFILFIGLKGAGVVVSAPDPVLVKLGELGTPSVLLSVLGIPLVIALTALRVPGGIIITIVLLTLVGLVVPAPGGEGVLTAMPEALVATPVAASSLWLALDLEYLWQHAGATFPVVISLMFMDLFNSLVALNAMSQRAGLVDANGTMLRPRRALSVDAVAAAGGAAMGTSTVICYIESASGIESGGRTGLVAVFVGTFFLMALFLNPLIMVIPQQATAPALVLIGLLMFAEVRKIDFTDPYVSGPAALTLLLMPVTSISDGLAIGLIVYVAVLALAGRIRQVHPLSAALAAAFLLYYLV